MVKEANKAKKAASDAGKNSNDENSKDNGWYY